MHGVRRLGTNASYIPLPCTARDRVNNSTESNITVYANKLFILDMYKCKMENAKTGTQKTAK